MAGRGRSKPLRRGDQSKAMTTDGVMGRVHGSRRDPRKDRKSRDGRIDRNLVEIDQAKYSTGDNTLALGDLTSNLKVAMASSMEMTWRGPMDSFLPPSRGFGDEQPLKRSWATSFVMVLGRRAYLSLWRIYPTSVAPYSKWRGGLRDLRVVNYNPCVISKQ
ncbi:hypothetical protein Acr_23g0014040 [Actinidia rufa]|uniref:Uncharacterized protein n=1 Tax=Actinidia rufa TaxID=165716 RepID=A0A7J0GQF2_9ERIC|nr:hypothetical protein Acr_23g0014040 [Actinidia rufa]